MELSALVYNLRYGMNDDVLNFFVAVSRFDYAFKIVGGFFTRTEGKVADIDWQDLVPKAFDGFDQKCADLKELELFTTPPREFKRKDGKAQFLEQPPALTDTKSVFWAIWTLRKNLVHGTKGKMFARDLTLCRDANVVLERAYRFCQESDDQRLKEVAKVMAQTEAYDDVDSGA